jgi:ribose transport system permease protein
MPEVEMPVEAVAAAPGEQSEPHGASPSRRGGVLRVLAFRNISALYLLAGMVGLFALWVPDTFLTASTWRSLLDQQALTAMVAVALVIPLAAGVFDLAIGAEVGMGAIISAWLIGKHGVGVAPAIVLTLGAGAAIGLVVGLLVIRARIDSFIATLGVSSILLAMIAWASGNTQILDLGSSFQSIAAHQLFGITLPVYLLIVIAAVVWYVLERTPAGRRVYATGGNREAARLAGVRTSRIIIVAFVACGSITAAAGVLSSARLAVGDPTIGPAFLLPAFAAAFLGSTQFRGGRYNVWGTVVAVYVLAVGVKGLQLAGAPTWIPDLFNGVALLVAVGLAKAQSDGPRGARIRRVLSRRGTRLAS